MHPNMLKYSLTLTVLSRSLQAAASTGISGLTFQHQQRRRDCVHFYWKSYKNLLTQCLPAKCAVIQPPFFFFCYHIYLVFNRDYGILRLSYVMEHKWFKYVESRMRYCKEFSDIVINYYWKLYKNIL